MALSSTFRWVVVGSLKIRPHQKAPPDLVQSYTIDDLAEALRELANEDHRRYSKDTREMWCGDVESGQRYYVFLLNEANSNAADVAFYNSDTDKTRHINKEPSESGLYSSHILVRKEPDDAKRHLVLIEKVPGVYLSSVKAHFGWAFHSVQDDCQPRTHLPVFELDGYQSMTVREALAKGTLQNLEFIRVIKNYSDGLDEDAAGVDELVQSASLKAKTDVTGKQAREMLKRIRTIKDQQFEGDSETQVYVRIKTGDGQSRRSEIRNDDDSVLEEAFVHNERVGGFAEPLPTTYTKSRKEMIHKLAKIGDRLCRGT